jgi:hypothetical protein
LSFKAAFEQAKQLDHGWVGPEHFLLAVLATSNPASDALGGLGVTYELVRQHLQSLRPDPDIQTPKARAGMTMNPAAHEVVGWAQGYAAASRLTTPAPEHWLMAILYASDRGAMWLHPFGVSAKAAIDSLALRGANIPAFSPPEYQPWHGHHYVYVSKEELQPVIDVLNEKYPASSDVKWGFNLVGTPRRGRISAEEGIDLDQVVMQAREGLKAKASTKKKRTG